MAESSEASEGPPATPSAQPEAGLCADAAAVPPRPTKPRKRPTPWSPYEPPGSLKGKLLSPFRREIEADLKAYASGLEQALRAEFEGLRGQIDTSLEALEGRLLAFENQTNTRLEALEAKFALLSPQDSPGEQFKLPKRPQDSQEAPDAPRAKTTHGPPSRAASARPGRAAAPELTPIPGTSKPCPRTPPVQPRWADIAAGEQSGWKTVNNKRRAAEKALKGAQPSSPGDLKPTKGEHKEDRRLIFRRSDPKVSPKAPREDVILTLNRFLTQAGFPSFMRIVDANYTETGALSALLNR
ncbi:hypothetical protein ACJ73_09249, partial [Blastomyces percursus]